MADLSVTAANVVKSTGAQVGQGTAGETITAGQPIYLASDGTWYKGKSSGTLIQATATAIALCGASAGQPIVYQSGGNVKPGATVAVGTIYVVSTNAGGIAPAADLAGTNYVTVLGIGIATDTIQMLVGISNIQHA